MKSFLFIILVFTAPCLLSAQRLQGFSFRVINMIPATNSNETNFDSETNVAVNPLNTNKVVGSAFTRNPSGTSTAPIFISTNGGTNWAMNNIVPSGNGMTGDISVGFSRNNNLYAGILRGGSGLRSMVLRTSDPAGAALMTILRDRNTETTDQPYVTSSTVNDGGGIPKDRAFIGVNNLSGSGGLTAEVMTSNDAASAPPSAFNNLRVEVRTTNGQDMPAIRAALHSSGVVYAIFYRWVNTSIPSARCDVVVVRDDNFASGGTAFSALTDVSDGNAGRRVAANVLVPAFSGTSLGGNRLVASNLSIAVDPGNAATVYIAWCDRVGTSDYTLHVRRSTDSGVNWSRDLLTVTNATNPAIAINNSGRVAVVYQQLSGITRLTNRWFTHFRSTPRNGTVFSNDTLSIFLNSVLVNSPISPALGDYLDVESVGNTFYGVFPAGNVPRNGNFPRGVVYQRHANFTSQTLLGNDKTTTVNPSVDPFFFKISPFTLCQRFPGICRPPSYSKDFLLLECLATPCGQKAPIRDICKKVLDCPGCGPNALCLPWYHIFLEELDPATEILLLDKKGNEIGYELNKTENGVAVSFKVDQKALTKEGIPDYDIVFVNEKGFSTKKIKIRIEPSNYRFSEHVKH